MTRAALAFLLAVFGTAPARAAIYIVRHAEKASAGDAMAGDPPLTAAGLRRAAALARVLRSTRLSAVYVTQFLRTRQTGAPTADEFGLKPTRVKAEDPAGLARTLESASGDVLVVAHSDTIPDLLRDLGAAGGPRDELAANDYDNLFVVDLSTSGAALHWLHYGPANPR